MDRDAKKERRFHEELDAVKAELEKQNREVAAWMRAHSVTGADLDAVDVPADLETAFEAAIDRSPKTLPQAKRAPMRGFVVRG